MTLVLAQILILALLVAGWGYWIWKFLFNGRPRFRFDWLVAGLAGYVAQLVLLDATTRVGVPLRISAWPALAIGGLGVVGVLRWGLGWWATSSCRTRKEVLATLGLFAVVFAFQCLGLLHEGPQNYYGKGRSDQMLWVTYGQYLLENGLPASTVPEPERQPWALLATSARHQRITAAVANAELAVVSLTHAKAAYGVQSIFFAALVPLCVFTVFRSFSIWLPLAFIGSVWVGVLPSLTKIHLDGFFAQVSVLFVFPLLLAACRFRLDRHWRGLVVIAIFLAYLFIAYTDFYPFALVLLALLFACPWPRREKGWTLRFGMVVILSLSLSALYLRLGVMLFLYHFHVANSKPAALELLVPRAGTVWGWSETFFRPLPVGATPSYDAVSLCILLAALVGISAFFSRSLRNRYYLVAAAAAPVAYLSVLVAGGSYPKYPFWKVSDSFAWLLVLMFLMGCYRLALLIGKHGPARVVSLVAACGFAVLSFFGFLQEMRVVLRGEEILTALNKPPVKLAFRYLDEHPRTSILIREKNPVVVGWLSYHGRKGAVYLDRNWPGDSYLPPGNWTFYSDPPDERNTLVWNGEDLTLLRGAARN